MKGRSYGFTIIEILIALVIIGVLSSIAVPQYGKFVRDSRRTDAHIALRSAAQRMERCRSQSNFSYVGCALASTTSEDNYYDLKVEDRSRTDYTLTATAKTDGSQAGDKDCASMTINARGITAPAACW